MVETQQKLKRLRRGRKNTRRNCIKKIQMNHMTTMVWSATQIQTFWKVKSSGPQEALLLIKLVDVMKFHALNVLHSICQQVWKTQQQPPDWKRLILIPIPKKDSTKECSNHQMTALISQASKFMLKILHARLQCYMNRELPDIQAGFRKGRGTRD